MTRDIEILEANQAFYRAFAARDLAAMAVLWAVGVPVACIHPGWDAIDGRQQVLASFRAILESPAAPAVRCTLARAHLIGETGTAFVTCHELVQGARLVATNGFVREEGAWRLFLHQSTPLAPGQARARPPEPELRS
jgi:ketosteroid isomerase-like protein